ncbi:unnamed protein product [Rotaria sordida]|uniref:Uncharacterized protein n=1 Tax=Rotaria sordida TaxID=392033 RepID=A0A814HYS7_9BILA|nr:unnamed protein product [Rotaria sordida]CAF1083219.1 unnamed protein product [Rotaria sordida]CAF1107847.1 unnamed protein product [Rotaria sordida]CAF1174702.1 unnamed protein product [Rotaria sordida]CAF1431453.1 unnamed protein product [Rotaria sordida]
MKTKFYFNPLTQEIIQLPKIIYDIIECILIRLISDISLEQISILRCCLPNFLYQLFQQKPYLIPQNVVDWIVQGIRIYNK